MDERTFTLAEAKQLLPQLEERLLAFQVRYEQRAKPFQWAFTRVDLATLLTKLKAKEMRCAA